MNYFSINTVVFFFFCTMGFSLDAFSLFSSKEKSTLLIAYDPFEALIGMSEKQFFNDYGFSDAGKEFLQTKLQGKQGTFYVKRVEPFPRLYLQKPALIFSIVEGGENPTGKLFQKNVDVTALQALPKNNGAVFQVASNLSCLESSGTKQERIMHYCGARA